MFKTHLILIFILLLGDILYSQESMDTIWTKYYPDVFDGVVTPDGSKVIVALEGSVQVLDASSGEVLHTFYETDEYRNKLYVSNDNRYLYSLDLIKWDIQTFQEVSRSELDHPFIATDMAVTQNGDKIYYTSTLADVHENWAIIEISTSTMEEINTTGYFGSILSLSISNDDSQLAVTTQTDCQTPARWYLNILDSESYETNNEVYFDEYRIDDIEFSKDSEDLWYTSDGNLFSYNISSETTETLIRKSQSTFTRFIVQSESDSYFIVNDWKIFSCDIYDENTLDIVGSLPIRTTKIFCIENQKVLIRGEGRLLYYYDVSDIISSINEVMIRDLKLQSNRISFYNEEIIRVSIHDYLGNEYLNQQFNPGEINISLDNLIGGFYLFTYSNGESIQTIKFIRG